MQPLHVRINLSSPLAAFDKRPSYLDGLLSGANGEMLLALHGLSPREVEGDPFQAALDLSEYLDSTEIGGEKIWKASRLVPTWTGPLHWWTMTRKTDPLVYKEGQESGLVKSNRSSVDLYSGQERNFFWYLPIRAASHVDAWCIGDLDAVQELLATVRAIGKHRNNGFGIVSSFSVNVDVEADMKWRWRPLPAAESTHELEDPAIDYALSFETVRPPYWDALARKKCRIPVLV